MEMTASRSVDDLPVLPSRGPFGRTLQFRNDPLGFLRDLSRGGDIFRVRLLDKLVVVVTSPDLLHEVLVDRHASLRKSPVMRYVLYPLAGEGLLTSRGELWRKQRKLMAPIFTPAQIASFADAMVQCAQRAADTWRDGQTVDAWRETTRIAMSVAGKTMFDAETFSEADEIGNALTVAVRWSADEVTSVLPVLQSKVQDLLERLSGRLPQPLGERARGAADRLHGPLFYFTGEDRRLAEAIALLDERVQRMIDQRRAGEPRPDLLGRLLQARDEDNGARMSDRQVRDEILTLFVAGHETTATALAWCLYLLARHPEIHAAARAEADALGRPPRYEDLPKLRLAAKVFKEALRMYTPFPMFDRLVAEDIEVGGHRVPAGSVLLIPPYAMHHRPDIWPDPERFDPERFRPEAEAARSRHAFLPFSAGPRVCIGNHFALMEGPLVLATLLQRADLELPGAEPIEPEIHGTLRPRGGVPMRVKLRPRLAVN
jgi:cytochrome P450